MNILNDTEHRIFLSAMSREEKICKRLDDFEDSGIKLFPICKSIQRKVDRAGNANVYTIGEGETLVVTTDLYPGIKRVLLQDSGTGGTLFYPDPESDNE